MIVTFVSQCEKKALNKTRRVLDAFANRIGNNTWQTVITEQGLQAVKKLLRKTATKNTAVSCHWIRSRSRSEFVWVVGNRNKFNQDGVVPVNSTQKNILNTQWENDWNNLPLIKGLVAVAALFHDWGKSSELFQAKLQPSKNNKTPLGDPLRHEWISVLFLHAFVGKQSDEEWLNKLAEGVFNKAELIQKVTENSRNPMQELPAVALTVSWLILTHHRMPKPKSKPNIDQYRGEELTEFKLLFKLISAQWGYQNKFDEAEFNKNLPRCFDFSKGLPSNSTSWLKQAKKWGAKLQGEIKNLQQTIENNSWRLVLYHARLALMLGDHGYSSKDKDQSFSPQLKLYANTDNNKKLKQSLEEHLLGVMRQSLHITHLLPLFENNKAELPFVMDIRNLKNKSPRAFKWQDTAVSKIKAWRSEQDHNFDKAQFGFFTINMASTGTGKTFANAKIMHELSVDQQSLRYILALGLRTLTLQTGDEYKTKIGLKDDELAVLIGSKTIALLHQQKQKTPKELQAETGSESEDSLFEDEIIFDCDIPDGELNTILQTEKQRALLYAPVLTCTIDHIMGATETSRGGRYILPSLRLMSSDLVIDEIDDFTGEDLIAIGRLIHLAGMLGRKVMISSATIPPDLAEGYFHAYQTGRQVFASSRQKSNRIGCAWVDEFGTKVDTLVASDSVQASFQELHQQFISKRTNELDKEPVKRKVNIVDCQIDSYLAQKKNTRPSVKEHFFNIIYKAILDKHQQHFVEEQQTQKQISFGVVRIANIDPCIQLTRFLLNAEFPANTVVKVMAYHSRQVMVMRNAQEEHLDVLLKRNADDEQAIFKNKIVQQHITKTKAKNIIFILVATPVEEVGRDHDLDWAVIEPSSLRSIIQLSGRVLRHRKAKKLNAANIAILQYNLKGLQQKCSDSEKNNPVFLQPGYESYDNKLHNHDINNLINTDLFSRRLDASFRIKKSEQLAPMKNLADLEHYVTHLYLTNYDHAGPETMQGWLANYWWLTGLPQFFVRFRRSSQQVVLYLMPDEDKDWVFKERNDAKELVKIENRYDLTHENNLTDDELNNLWLLRDYQTLLENTKQKHIALAASIFGEININTYGKELSEYQFNYVEQLGLEKD